MKLSAQPTSFTSTSTSTLTERQRDLIHYAVQLIAHKCDGASALDGEGFNKFDAVNGRFMAGQKSLNEKNARYMLRVIRKYKRQLPDEVCEQLGFGEVK